MQGAMMMPMMEEINEPQVKRRAANTIVEGCRGEKKQTM